MNTLPEWFTVEAKRGYEIRDVRNGNSRSLTGGDLRRGLSAESMPGKPLRLIVLPK